MAWHGSGRDEAGSRGLIPLFRFNTRLKINHTHTAEAAVAAGPAAGGGGGRVRVHEPQRAAREEGEPREAARVERAAQAEGAAVREKVVGL